VPAQDSTGRGVNRGFDHANILQATQLFELSKAGLSGRQLHRIAAVQRERLAHLSPAARAVGHYRLYINTITLLATLFGQGPEYESWLKTQMKWLKRMEADLAGQGEDAGPELDERLLRRLLAARASSRTPASSALAR
jgi:hypothetical protein